MPFTAALAGAVLPLLLFAAPPASTPPPAAPAAAPVQRGDANRDGVVDEKEMTALVTEEFKAADTNRDGKLTPEEIQAAAGREFDAADANRDGRLTAEELADYRCGGAGDGVPARGPAPAPAQGPQRPVDPRFDPRAPAWPQTDRNGNGVVDPLECRIQAGAEHSWMSGSGSRSSTTTKIPGGSQTVTRSEYSRSGGSVGVGVDMSVGQAIDLGQKLVGFFGKKKPAPTPASPTLPPTSPR